VISFFIPLLYYQTKDKLPRFPSAKHQIKVTGQKF